MDRYHQMGICNVCLKKDFLLEKGMVCSLTNEKATFIDTCSDYVEDELATAALSKNKESTETFSLNFIGITNRITAGLIFALFGVALLLVGLYKWDQVLVSPFIPITAGILAMALGYKKSQKKKTALNLAQSSLDGEDLGKNSKEVDDL